VPLNETRDSLVSGVFNMRLSTDAYVNFYINREGLEYFLPNLASGNEVTHFEVGSNAKGQVIGAQNSIPSITLTRDYYINLKDLNAKKGSEFYFNFRAQINFSSFTINFVENYIDSSSRGATRFSLNKYWATKTQDSTISIYCKYDGSNWYIVPATHYNMYDVNMKGSTTRTNTSTLTTAP
jgi:hypothetical protein